MATIELRGITVACGAKPVLDSLDRIRVTAALDSHVAVAPGTLLPLRVPVERLHLFDAETGVSSYVGQRRSPDQASAAGAHA